MKRLLLLMLTVAFILASTTVYAAQKAPLGVGNIAVKLDYIYFTDDAFDDADIDSGFYVGLEGYGMIVPNLYLGVEGGYANPDDNNTELTFVPIELNLKYAIEATSNFVIDLGGGGSYNYIEIESGAESEDDWIWGGQFFVDLNYTIDQFFLGISGKYQITEDFEDSGIDLNNWRVGGQIGVMF